MSGTITIGNRRRGDRGEYVGRAMPRQRIPASPLGNPFRVVEGEMSRENAIHQYTMWLAMHLELGGPVKEEFERLVELARQGNLTLCCWCSPLPCHADEIKRRIEAVLRGGQ